MTAEIVQGSKTQAAKHDLLALEVAARAARRLD
jgi:hypothetical protein